MTEEPRDPLVEAALTATEGGEVDWAELREQVPAESATIDELAVLTGAMAAQRGLTQEVGVSQDTSVFSWGPLEVRRCVGTGTFGDVYLAWDPRLQREVALKLRRQGMAERSHAWLQEARRLARVRHPGVVTVHGADLHDGRAGLWMEQVRGRTLEDRLLHEGPLGAREAALVGADLCGALAAVHAAGLVHGDVKTHNIMREGTPGHAREAGRIVLMDFGSSHESAGLSGGLPGTPLFTAPEVLAGGRATAASDIWSLGVVLYRLVTGQWPVEAATVADLRARLADPGLTPLRIARSDLPAKFVAAVERALERDPSRRWKDAAALERELLGFLGTEGGTAEEWARRRAARRRQVHMLWAGALLAGALTLTWLGVTRGERAWRTWRMRGAPLVGRLVDHVGGTSANAALGCYVIDAGDLNGDGKDDVAVSAPGAAEHGEVYVYTADLDRPLKPWLTLEGEHASDGYAGLASGDLNGDGHPDLIVSAIFSDAGAKDAGRVYVYFGGPQMDDKPDAILDGTEPAQYFGWGLAAGDVNGDHIDDLIVGAPYDRKAGPITGRAWVYLGGRPFDTQPDLEVSSGAKNSSFGISTAYLGDFNADGFGDFAVGAPRDPGGGQDRGATFVYFGGRQLHDRPDLVLDGSEEHGGFGQVRQEGGDLNGDGYPDLTVTSEAGRGLEPHAGSVTVYFGGPEADARPDLVLKGERRGDGFSKWVDSSKDLDGDGNADVLVTSPWADVPGGEGGGKAYVFLGGRQLDDVPDYVVDGPAQAALLGWGGCIVKNPAGGVGGLVLGVKDESHPTTQSGGIELIDLERWNIRAPGPRDGWVARGTARLYWTGSTRCDVSLSVDGGRTWREVVRDAGGEAVNQASVTIPAEARGSVQLRLSHASDHVVRTIPLG